MKDAEPEFLGPLQAAQGRRVAIIHYWLVGMRGGEMVLEALCRMFPEADIFTHVVDPSRISPTLRQHRIIETRIGRLPMARKLYQKYLPIMPRALEELDLRGYDLVISSEAGPAKGIIPPPDAPHLCYCHSPMRYIWDQYHLYRESAGPLTRAALPFVAHGLRQWDVASAARVDAFAANSNHVAARIGKYWRREARVIHPPVAIQDFSPVPLSEVGDYYLWLGELVPYKRPDIAVEAFRRLGRPLLVLGGPASAVRRLQRGAGPQTQFLGKVGANEVRNYLARCKALIFPGEEDFGIVPVEALASGRPVIGYGRGGLLDTVQDGETGVLFWEQTVEGLMSAVDRFEESGLMKADTLPFRSAAERFTEPLFRAGIASELARLGVGRVLT